MLEAPRPDMSGEGKKHAPAILDLNSLSKSKNDVSENENDHIPAFEFEESENQEPVDDEDSSTITEEDEEENYDDRGKEQSVMATSPVDDDAGVFHATEDEIRNAVLSKSEQKKREEERRRETIQVIMAYEKILRELENLSGEKSPAVQEAIQILGEELMQKENFLYGSSEEDRGILVHVPGQEEPEDPIKRRAPKPSSLTDLPAPFSPEREQALKRGARLPSVVSAYDTVIAELGDEIDTNPAIEDVINTLLIQRRTVQDELDRIEGRTNKAGPRAKKTTE